MRCDEVNGLTVRRRGTVAAMLLGILACVGLAPLYGCGDKVKIKDSTIEESSLEPDLDDDAELDEDEDVDIDVDDDDDELDIEIDDD